MTTKEPLNQILYGPPGTGKTYNTIYKALDILAPTELEKNPEEYYTWSELENANIDDSIIKEWKNTKEYEESKSIRDIALDLFDKFKKQERIVMTTFHQSMSYEDFVEGIKPNIEIGNKGERAGIQYMNQPGILKQLCDQKYLIKSAFKALHDEIDKKEITIEGDVFTRNKTGFDINKRKRTEVATKNDGSVTSNNIIDWMLYEKGHNGRKNTILISSIIYEINISLTLEY